jgi:uncharacterized protein (DUF342 family)
MMLAEGNIQWPATIQFIIGLVGVLSIISLVFGVAIQARKLFGRNPPINDDLKSLRSEIYHSKNSLRKEFKEVLSKESHRITALEELYREMQLDRERKWKELQTELHELEITTATLTERISAVLKKLEEKA